MRFSSEVEHIAGVSRDEAMRTGHYGICADHLALAILRCDSPGARTLLESLGIDRNGLKEAIDNGLFRQDAVPYADSSEVRYAESALSAFNMASLEAMKCGAGTIRPEHLLAGICRCAGSITNEWMKASGADSSKVSAKLREMSSATYNEKLPDAEEIADEISRELESVHFMPVGNKIAS